MMLAVGGWYGAAQAVIMTREVASELDRARWLAALTPRAQATVVFDRNGQQVFTFYAEQRFDVPLSRVSPHMVGALLAVEDRRFFSHHGVDAVRIGAAGWRNVRAGRIREGGSTLTQQLARATLLSPDRTYQRKLREIMIAVRLEQRYTKHEILEAYLNTVYFGEGYYGVEAASRGYFNTSAADLHPHEAALLAALVRSPSADAPRRAPERALARRNLVLALMRNQGRLDEGAFASARSAPLPDRAARQDAVVAARLAEGQPGSGRYFEEELRRQLVALFGNAAVLQGGLRVYSTYDPAMQREAELAVTTRIAEIVKIRPAAKALQGSFVAMDPASGDVLALVGGRDFTASSFNRATQARRQAGSAFKPIIYAAALERGFGPGSMLQDLDRPIAAVGGPWLPGGLKERSAYTLRRALRVSSNRAAAQLLQQVGVSTAIHYAARLGISSHLPPVPSLALGSGEVTLLELTASYTAFANQGMAASPRLIARVEDSQGKVLFAAAVRRTRAISPVTAYLMSHMLAEVISRGSANGVRAAGFTLPAAGKTGTTNDYADAWFVGYTPNLVAGVWFGLDRPAPIMRGGFASVVAVPAWGRFMRAATAGATPDWYEQPAGIETVAMCRRSGARAVESCRYHADYAPVVATYDPSAMDPPPVPASASDEPSVYEDMFPSGSAPGEFCAWESRIGSSLHEDPRPRISHPHPDTGWLRSRIPN
ncbi:MAG: PBP1A family penicillin-binding protein [Acidobacteria bacterium]|nr:PBP1A family penicillin-binding protein [Acidobacteriota bacterium]